MVTGSLDHARQKEFGTIGGRPGADESRPGHFVTANGGTLFLDEIGDKVSDAQPMLLRVLDDRRVQPLGSSHTRPVDVRVIAATDARLEGRRSQLQARGLRRRPAWSQHYRCSSAFGAISLTGSWHQ